MSLLISLLLLIVIVSIALALTRELPDPTMSRLARIVVLVAFLIVLVSWWGGAFSFPSHRGF